MANPDQRKLHSSIKILAEYERGVVFRDEPHLIAKMPDHDLWMFFVRDSEGNLIGLMSEVMHG